MAYRVGSGELAYNPITGWFTWVTNRKANLVGKRAGFVTKKGYREVYYEGKYWKEHRLAFKFMGEPVPEEADHKDLDKANNKWINLRPTGRVGNTQNVSLRKDNKLGYKGVSVGPKGAFVARIQANKKPVRLGTFKCVTAAAVAYRRAAIKLHGEYANF